MPAELYIEEATVFNANAPQTIRFAVNTSGQDKNWDYEKLATKFKDFTGTIYDVKEHVLNGHALCAGNLNGKRRCKANIAGSNFILVDIDNSEAVRDADGKVTKIYKPELTLDQALVHPFVKKYCGLIYTTASHTTEWHKFRLIFLLPEYIDDVVTLEAAIKLLLGEFPHDPACKDASRVFYGSTKAEFPLVNPNAALPTDWVEKAQRQAKKDKLETELRLLEWSESCKSIREYSTNQGWDTDALIEEALSYIPPRMPGSNNYQECTQVLMALVSHYGAAEAEIIGEKWSPSIKGDTWNIRKKINSYKRGGIGIGTLFHIAQQHGFRFPSKPTGKSFGTSQFNKKGSSSNNSGGNDGNPPISGLTLRERIIEILFRGLSLSEEKEAFINLAESVHKPLGVIEGFAKVIRGEIEVEEDRSDTIQELQQLIAIKNQKLELKDYLHPDMADPLVTLARWMGIPQEAFLVPLLSVSASLLSSKMKICANAAANFYQPFIFYTGLVCETGSKKSPIINIFLKPLSQLQVEEDKRYRAEKLAYEKELREWKESDSKNKEEPPSSPVLREYYVKNATHEALDEIRATQESGFIYVLDELSGLTGSYGAYKGGKGADKESILSGFDGNGVKINRAGGKRLSNPHDAMSITGAIQHQKLKQQMGNMEDCQGEWARFLWIAYDEILQRLPDNENSVHINEILSSIFSRLLAISTAMPDAIFSFEQPGKVLFNDYVYELDKQRFQETRPGMKGALAKLKGYTARLAGITYLLACAANNEMPSTVIPTEYIKQGIKLSQYFLGQVELIYAGSGESKTQSAPALAKILELAKQQADGRISNRAVCKKLKIKRETNLINFQELEKMGYGTIEYKRQGFDFVLNPLSPTVTANSKSPSKNVDAEKSFNNNTFNPNNTPPSPVSPLSPPFASVEDDSTSNEFTDANSAADILLNNDYAGNTGNAETETQAYQGFEQCPQQKDPQSDSKKTGDTTAKNKQHPQHPTNQAPSVETSPTKEISSPSPATVEEKASYLKAAIDSGASAENLEMLVSGWELRERKQVEAKLSKTYKEKLRNLGI